MPDAVDLAVIATPAATVPGIVGECAAAAVKGAVIISAGFKECGPAGAELEKQILEQRGKMRIIGPNCVGVMLPHIGLNATFAKPLALPGNIGFISQSGALCTAILDWSRSIQLGFSAFISIGSMADVNWGDLIDHLGDDPHTRSILLYMESVGDARSFLSAAREVALTKPIIAIKVGRSGAAAKAAASHTGALTGSDDVLDAAFRRVGVLRVDTIEELFGLAELLGKQPRPAGPRLAIVTNGGGPGVLATDALIECGGKLAELSPNIFGELNKLLPPHWSRGNPVDILGDASPETYAKAVEIVARDENNDGLLVILSPQAVTEPTRNRRAIARVCKAESQTGSGELDRRRRCACGCGDPGSRGHSNVCISRRGRARVLRDVALLPQSRCALRNTGADRDCRDRQITRRTDHQSRKESAAHAANRNRIQATPGGLRNSAVETKIATTEEEAVELAQKIGGPVVLKIYSETITHKSDVGGVKLNLRGAAAVRRAYREIAAQL